MQGDYEGHQRQIVAKEQIPDVFRLLIEGADVRVVAAIAEEVEEHCGIRPEEETVRRYLRRVVLSNPEPRPVPTPQPGPTLGKRPELTVGGETKTFRTNRECLIEVFETLATRDPTFCERYSTRRVHVRRRRQDLSPRQQKYAQQLRSGWWIGTGGQIETKYQQVRTACDVAGIEYERDLTVLFVKGPKWSRAR